MSFLAIVLSSPLEKTVQFMFGIFFLIPQRHYPHIQQNPKYPSLNPSPFSRAQLAKISGEFLFHQILKTLYFLRVAVMEAFNFGPYFLPSIAIEEERSLGL